MISLSSSAIPIYHFTIIFASYAKKMRKITKFNPFTRKNWTGDYIIYENQPTHSKIITRSFKTTSSQLDLKYIKSIFWIYLLSSQIDTCYEELRFQSVCWRKREEAHKYSYLIILLGLKPYVWLLVIASGK